LKMPLCGIADKDDRWDEGQVNGLSPESKLHFRAHHRCPCDMGTRDERPRVDKGQACIDVPLSRLPGKWLPFPHAGKMAEGEEKRIESILGFIPGMCAYQALQSPIVMEVWRWLNRIKMNPGLYNDSMPNWLFEALAQYEGAYITVSNHYNRKLAEKIREQNKTKNKDMPNVKKRF
jgi:hypothetical protein